MNKRIEKFLSECVLILIPVIIVGLIIINKANIGETSIVSGEIRNKKNDVITFDSSILKEYTNVMLEMSQSENISNGLKFDIFNPKGELVDSGVLYDNHRLNKSYKGVYGEWKIRLDFQGEDSSAMIASGFASTSKKENNMRVVSGLAKK